MSKPGLYRYGENQIYVGLNLRPIVRSWDNRQMAESRARGVVFGARIAALLCTVGLLHSATPAPVTAESAAKSPADAAAAFTSVEEIYQRFEIDRGCFALLALDARKWSTFGSSCADAYLPASSFKVANALIGLETGVIEDARHQLPWDGVRREHVAAWNRDHDLESAMEHSVLWYFQDVARRVGEHRYRDWLARMDYGNRAIGGGIDRFWVAGDLRITPRQQVVFVDRMLRGDLPVSARSMTILRTVMPSSEKQVGDTRFVVRAKTGLTSQSADRVGWLIGWIEAADGPDGDSEPTHVFASLVLGSADQDWRESPTFAARSALPMAILGHLGVIPLDQP